MSSFITEHSCELYKPELDLFTQLPTQASVHDGYTVEHGTLNNLDSEMPLRFEVSSDGSDYIDLLNSYLYLEVKITNPDGSNIADDANVAPINLLGVTLFKQCDIKLNDTLVTQANNLYQYRGLIETLLSYGEGAKNGPLTMSLFYKDTAGQFDSLTADNAGFTKRKALAKGSKVIPLISRIHADICLQNRYIVNNVDIAINLYRNADSFVLMGANGAEFKLKIVKASYFVRKVSVNPTIQQKHIQKMDKELTPAVYPLRRIEMKSYSIATGSLSFTEMNLFTGPLPKKVVVMLIDSAAYHGAIHRNPLNLQHKNINYIALYKDGTSVPLQPLQPNFAKNNSLRSYFSMLEVSGKHFTDSDIGITREEFESGYHICGFDLTPDLDEKGCYHLIKKGNLKLDIKFEQGLSEPTQCIIYAEFDSHLFIDRNRSVLVERGG